MKLIVDTNIVFSSILNTDSKIGDLILNSENVFEFYSVSFLKKELENHKEKLIQISKLSSKEIDQVKLQIYSKIHFISEDLIPFEFWKRSIEFVREVDMDDIAFVALSFYMEDTVIWTGDEKLRKGIIQKGFNKVIGTQDVLKLREELEQK